MEARYIIWKKKKKLYILLCLQLASTAAKLS